MSRRREGERRRSSGTAGGADLEPLRGGMREQESGKVGPEQAHAPDREPRVAPGRDHGSPAKVHRRHGSTRREGTPPRPTSAEIHGAVGEKVEQVRRDYENEAGNAPRRAPSPDDSEST